MGQIDVPHRAARAPVLCGLAHWEGSRLRVELPEGDTRTFGPHGAERRLGIRVHDNRFFTRLLLGGAIGAGESYMAGECEADDLKLLLQAVLQNSERDRFDALPSLPAGLLNAWRHRRRTNTQVGSTRNVKAHYDLGNRFFELFLGPSLTYSCAVWEDGGDLERAQWRTYQAVCDKLGIGAGDHVLEIGCGWGGFALHAVRATGCRVTGLTISREQYGLARRRVQDVGLADRIDVQHRDDRDVQGTFGKIASIEMFQAVGREYWTAFFRTCGRALRQGGSMLRQTIAIPDARVRQARRASGWIGKYIFPGGMLPAVLEIEDSLREGADALVIRDAKEIGPEHVRTLDEWRRRFWASIHRVRALGFDERFVRMWDFYLASCSAAFAARHIRGVQVVIGERSSQPNLGSG